MAKKRRYDRKKAVRALARERIGTPPPARPLAERPTRQKPKHKKPITEELEG